MAIKTNIDATSGIEPEVSYYDSTSDFNASNESYAAAPVIDPEKAEKKHRIKSDVFSLVATGVINGLPIVIDAIKNKKNNVPYKVDKQSAIKFGVSMILPTIKAVDTIALNGKIQTTIETKTPFKFSDIQNVANIVQAYPSTHRALTQFMSNVQAQSTGKAQVTANKDVTRDAILGCLNTVSPYVVDKFCDDNMTFVEKCSSVIPIKIFGGLVRKFVSTNPKLQQGYDMITSVVRVADYGNKTLSTAVRSNSNMRNNASNTLGSVLDVVQDLTGMTRGNISRYGDQYDGWNGGSRFNSY